MKNCVFAASIDNAFRVFGANIIILERCTARDSKTADGFNYHQHNGIIPKIIEINCLGYNNGLDSANDINNGSTIHDAEKIIRVNTFAWNNKGPNFADVTTGTESWNMGCIGFASASGIKNLGPIDFGFNAGNVKVWMDGCRAYSSIKSAIFGTTTDSVTAKVRNCNFEVAPEVGESSSMTTY